MSDSCWTLVASNSNEQPSLNELKTNLEKQNENIKIETMRKILALMLNGDPLPALLMHVIRFVLPSKNKTLKKLLFFYWELVQKKNVDGKLKQEMILVCNYIRNDLQSSNEFIRGMTLRLVTKLREAELLEPLLPSIRAGLEHKHAFVRKNAILAIHAIHKNLENLIPDAAELVYNYVLKEQDAACKRHAFTFLCNSDNNLAVSYLNVLFPQLAVLDEFMQLAIIQLIQKDCKTNIAAKAKYIAAIVSLLTSSSHAVKYEAATTLMSLTASPMAVKEVATCFITLATKESDNNVKLIVLDRLDELRQKHDRVLDELVMDVTRVLNSPDMAVCKKAMKIILDIISSRNVLEVVAFLKKEITKTHGPSNEKNTEYRQLLIHAIRMCAIKFPNVATDVIHVLMEFVSDPNNNSAVDVIVFVREVVERNESLRAEILEKLFHSLSEMKSGKVMRTSFWIAGEYSMTLEAIENSFKHIREGLGELPLISAEQKILEQSAPEENGKEPSKDRPSSPARRVLADGTYASESAYIASPVSPKSSLDAKARPPIRGMIVGGDYFLASVLAACLVKLVLRAAKLTSSVSPPVNSLRAQAMLIITSIIRLGQSSYVKIPIDEDAYERLILCLRVLGNADGAFDAAFLELCHELYSKIVLTGDKKLAAKQAADKKLSKVGVDQVIGFRQLRSKGLDGVFEHDFERDLLVATGMNALKDDSANRLNRIVQLTGFSDTVYAEAFVDVHQYDILLGNANIILDVLIVNQTSDTLQNLVLEFATLGDLKLVERPTSITMAPHSFHTMKANIKVSSTETGVIFGNIVYDSPVKGSGDSCVVVLNDVHIDIMDYITPGTCTETQFLSMWTEFEWENKININTNMTDLRQFMDHVLKCTNMACLTPESALRGDCGFVAANLHARSIFGEDALANIALEQHGNSPITGHIRIRSKTQGIALSLGDKITVSQKVKA